MIFRVASSVGLGSGGYRDDDGYWGEAVGSSRAVGSGNGEGDKGVSPACSRSLVPVPVQGQQLETWVAVDKQDHLKYLHF